MATADLQNSYGPELDASHNLPQAITSHDGLEAVPPQQPIAPPYHEQAEKNDTYHDHNNGTAYPPPRSGRKRILGLPVVAFWGVIVGLVVILAVALGAGLGVGLSQRSDSASATSASASASASPVSDTATTTTDAPSSSSSGASTTTSSSTTTTSEAPQATARNVEICQNASLDTCKNLTVPVNTCSTSCCHAKKNFCF